MLVQKVWGRLVVRRLTFVSWWKVSCDGTWGEMGETSATYERRGFMSHRTDWMDQM